jgi:hypothetical protein
VLGQMAESFCNQFHLNNFSVTEIDEDGKAIKEIHGHKGKGPRLCLVGMVTQFGPMATKRDGEWVRDHAWQNAAGQAVRSGGSFVELNREGNPRTAFAKPVRKKSLRNMKKDELLVRAQELDIMIPPDVKLKADIIEVIEYFTQPDLEEEGGT